MLVLLKGQSLSLFPLIKFPFLTWLPSSLSFIFTCLTLWCRNSEIHPTGWGLEKLRNWDELQDGTLHLPCWTDIHPLWLTTTPAHLSPIGYKGKWNPIPSDPLSLLPRFQVLGLGGRIPTAPGTLALCPIWLWNRGCPFQSRLLLLSEEVLRMGTPFLSDLSPHFLSPLSNFPLQPQWEILNPSPENLLLSDAFSET